MAKKVAAIIPCYKVKKHILELLQRIGQEVDCIYVIDDKCPQETGKFVLENQNDPRVVVLFNKENMGVGGAVITGYKAAINDGYYCAVKIDGDGQMDPSLIGRFIMPIINNTADYTKGNRFYNPEDVRKMPFVRKFGNVSLSFMQKFSSGYWDSFDPTNGYTAINLNVVKFLSLDKIHNRYFFESDLLFRLGTINSKVMDIPMIAIYEDEESNLKIKDIFSTFLTGHMKNTVKRIFYKYFVRDFSVGSIELIFGLSLLLFGISKSTYSWIVSALHSVETPPGTLMLSVIPLVLGMQLLLAFISYDIETQPKESLSSKI